MRPLFSRMMISGEDFHAICHVSISRPVRRGEGSAGRWTAGTVGRWEGTPVGRSDGGTVGRMEEGAAGR